MKWIFLIVTILFHANAFAFSMRRCSLLPISDGVSGAVGFQVFEEIEKKLKESNWCTYISNSSLLSIFSKYQDNLPKHLKSSTVLETISNKLKVGTLIRVDIVNEVHGAEVRIDILGSNGSDLYFSERSHVKEKDIQEISEMIINWLEIYSKMIPYDAQVIGVLGDQITLDAGKGTVIKEGQKILIKKLRHKKTHPLLKKIVDWNSEIVAEALVLNISDNQAFATINRYLKDEKIVTGDWARIDNTPTAISLNSKKEGEEEAKPGVLGSLSFGVHIANSSLDTTVPSGGIRMSGNSVGVDLRGEAWFTRHYFGGLDLKRGFSSLSESSGNPDKDKLNTNYSGYKLAIGYRYLPIGFFYGPRVDIYGGMVSVTYDSNFSAADGFGHHTFSGFLLGVGGSVPINREYKIFGRAEFVPYPEFQDKDSIYGDNGSNTMLEMEVGVKYVLALNITFDASLGTTTRKARFDDQYKEIAYKDTAIKSGLSFDF